MDETGLTGSIPPEVGNLANLRQLRLWNNDLRGSFPPELGKLGNLQSLWINGNDLSGPIPASFGQLGKLHTLVVYDNPLSGALPLSLAKVPLRRFSYHGTDLCVPVDESFRVWLAAITNHSGTDIDCPPTDRDALIALHEATRGDEWTNRTNWLSDAPIGEWHGVVTEEGRVTRLFLRGNNLVGSLPAELGGLPDLEVLDFRDNGEGLTGSIPAELGNLGRLEELYLAGNALSGAIPSELGNLEVLEYLDLGDNELNGDIPEELGQLENLTSLDLGNNGLDGSIPPDLRGLGSLHELDLSGNELTGAIPPELGALGELRSLGLAANELSGALPDALGDLENLTGLSVQQNQLSGPLPTSLAGLANLESFLYYQTDLCVPSDEDLRSWLASLALHNGTNVECPPPDRDALVALYDATGGEDWTNSTNWLSDEPIDDWYGVDTDSAGAVTRLSLRGNNLSGELPEELGDLGMLGQLELDNNGLTGPIPADLGQLAHLEHLWLYDNALTGSIPPEFGDLDSLRVLLVYNNSLAGPLPLSLANLSLDAFVYNGTDLCVPADETFRSWLASIPNHFGTGVDCAAGDPDLLVSSVRPAEVTLVAGGAADTVTFTILNGGDGAADSTTATIHASGDSTITTDDGLIGDTLAVPGLAASDSTAVTIALNAGASASAGTVYVGMCVEPVSGETDTGNNCSSAIKVTIVSSGVAGLEGRADVSPATRGLVVTVVRRGIGLEPEHQPEPALNPPHESPGYLSGPIGEVVLVNRQQLGHVRDRVPGEAGARRLKQHVARRVEEPRIRRESHADYGSEPAPVECVRLDDEDGAMNAGFGFARLVEVRPPYFPACDYQSSATERACARRIPGSIPLGESAYTEFNLAVMSASLCFATYSATAFA